MKNIGILFGTRPEIIKMYPVIQALKKSHLPFYLVHSNQHYSPEMDAIFFRELALDPAKYNLNAGSGSHAQQTAKIMTALEDVLIKDPPKLLLVHGDTNTTLAGALTASKMGIPVAHVEAGLRSYDRQMPEEINRVIVDHIADILFSVTPLQTTNLQNEGISQNKIFEVGNTVTDAVHWALKNKKIDSYTLPGALEPEEFLLATIHRPANVDLPESLKSVIDFMNAISEKFDRSIIWPIHPRTKAKIKEYRLIVSKKIIGIEPVGYFQFLGMLAKSCGVLTDSGGIQEEACIMNIPCVTLRSSTERPETLDLGANILIDYNNYDLNKIEKFIFEKHRWEHPFGNGQTGARIVDVLTKCIKI